MIECQLPSLVIRGRSVLPGIQGGMGVRISTVECDAHPNFKRVPAEAKPEGIVTFQSAAELTARAVLPPWLKKYPEREPGLKARIDSKRAVCDVALECLSHCGLKDTNLRAGQICTNTQLAAALQGNVEKGLFFCGSEALPVGSEIRPVRELLELLPSGRKPRAAANLT